MTVVKLWNTVQKGGGITISAGVQDQPDRGLRNPCFGQMLDGMTYGQFIQHGKVQSKE